MTRCNRNEVNLKSTAYNQTGQNYFEQLAAYNSMTSHLRRILLAKCVVDAKNRNYIQRRKQLYKDTDYKPVCTKAKITNNIIDRLAYDTLHHPADFLRMNYNSGYLCQREDRKYFTDCYNYEAIYSQSGLCDHITSASLSAFKSDKSESLVPNDQNTKRRSSTQSNCNKALKIADTKSAIKIHDASEQRMLYESQDVNRLSSSEGSSSNFENFGTAEERVNRDSNKERYTKEEEALYTTFVYEITREIMYKRLYTDKELQEVFNKHLERNKTVLDTNKMLYEIYQLKLTLNVTDDSNDEELEDLVHSQQLLSISKTRPPTPPKVLDDDKVVEKLRSYMEKDKIENDSKTSRSKSVIVVDANPELFVTESDVLTSLIQANINPDQAHKIYKELFNKSKDLSPMLQTKKDTTNEYTSDIDQSDSHLYESIRRSGKR